MEQRLARQELKILGAELKLEAWSMLEEIGAVISRHDSGESGLAVRVATSVLPGIDER